MTVSHLVECDDEGRLAHLEQPNRLDRLLLQPVHQVDDEHRDVAQPAATLAQIREGLVAWGVDDEQAWKEGGVPGGHVRFRRGTQANRVRLMKDSWPGLSMMSRPGGVCVCQAGTLGLGEAPRQTGLG